MKPINSIRKRLVYAAFLLACLVTALFATGLYIAFDTAEDELFDRHLQADVDEFVAAHTRFPALVDLHRDNFSVWVVREGQNERLPSYLVGLEADADEVMIDGREFQLHVRRQNGLTYYFLFDESDFEEFEQNMLLAMAVVALLVIAGAAGTGVMLANRIIRPLTGLAEHVRGLGNDTDFRTGLVSDTAADDEVALLARSIDTYHKRISDLLQREQEFSADVSHELRTPIMAVQGAAENLRRLSADDDAALQLIERINRGCFHMSTLTEALLFLAREPDSFQSLIKQVNVRDIIEEQVAALLEITETKGIRLQVEGSDASKIEAIPAVVGIVVGNILKNAVKHTDQQLIRVFFDDDQIVVQDFGPGIETNEDKDLFDRFERGSQVGAEGSGIGLALVRRFCEQYGWRIDLQSSPEIGTRVAVAF